MPFKSEKQRRYMHANHPEIADRWEHEMKDYHNSRNFDGDTYDEYREPSEVPFVSPDCSATMPQWSGTNEDAVFATGDIRVDGSEVTTRRKGGGGLRFP